jgi:hypothetical protein
MTHRAPRFEPLGVGPFAKAHAEITGIDTFDWAALGRSVEDPHARERGRRSFVLRALDEQRSLVAFSELLTELCVAGAPVDVIGSLTRVVRDEAFHVDLCGRVVEALGGWDDRAPDPAWVRSNKQLPLQRRILQTILGSLCIGETLSVAMIAGVRKHASDEVTHGLLTRLLADESFHSRFGWWWLESTPLSDEDRQFANAYLTRALPAVEASARPRPEAISKPHTYSPFGSMSALEREQAFVSTMESKILPGFDAAGLEASAIWARHREEVSVS